MSHSDDKVVTSERSRHCSQYDGSHAVVGDAFGQSGLELSQVLACLFLLLQMMTPWLPFFSRDGSSIWKNLVRSCVSVVAMMCK